jgi:hypothetical protein
MPIDTGPSQQWVMKKTGNYFPASQQITSTTNGINTSPTPNFLNNMNVQTPNQSSNQTPFGGQQSKSIFSNFWKQQSQSSQPQYIKQRNQRQNYANSFTGPVMQGRF